GAPGMANSTTSLSCSSSAYATVLGATLIRYSGILATSLVVSTRHDCNQPGVVQIAGRLCGNNSTRAPAVNTLTPRGALPSTAASPDGGVVYNGTDDVGAGLDDQMTALEEVARGEPN